MLICWRYVLHELSFGIKCICTKHRFVTLPTIKPSHAPTLMSWRGTSHRCRLPLLQYFKCSPVIQTKTWKKKCWLRIKIADMNWLKISQLQKWWDHVTVKYIITVFWGSVSITVTVLTRFTLHLRQTSSHYSSWVSILYEYHVMCKTIRWCHTKVTRKFPRSEVPIRNTIQNLGVNGVSTKR